MKEKDKEYLTSFAIYGFLFLFFGVSSLCSWNKGLVEVQISFGIISILFGIFTQKSWNRFWKNINKK